MISGAHRGLFDAIASTLVGAAWQRCLTHDMRKLLTRVPKPARSMVVTLVRTTIEQPDTASVWAQDGRVVNQLNERFPSPSPNSPTPRPA